MRLTPLLPLLTILSASCGGGDSSTGSTSSSDTAAFNDTTSGTAADATWTASDTSGPQATSASDTSSSWDAATGADTTAPTGNTNVNLGGAQDFGYPRALIAGRIVPQTTDLDAAGFFAEHSTPLPTPNCGERLCLQAMLGVMGNLINGANCTLLQLGINSPIVADPTQRPPLSLVVVVDVSGSMEDGNKIGFVRLGLKKLVNELKDGDQLALVTYSTFAVLRQPMVDVSGQRNSLHDLIDALAANGGTNLYDGLERGFKEAVAHYDSGRQNRLILLSDGMPTAGRTDSAAILAMSAAYNSEGVGITSIGLGTDFNLPLMRGLAEQGDGNFYFLENATAVDEVFTEELSYFTVPVAFDIDINVSSGPEYHLGAAHGSRLWESTEGGGHLSVPSVFLAHRTGASDVHEGPDGPGRRGGGSALLLELMPLVMSGEQTSAEVALIDFTFREPGTDRIVEQHATVVYPHAPWEVLSTGFFEGPIVTKSFVMLNIFGAINEACRLFHRGEAQAGLDVLLVVIAAAEDYEDDANDGAGDLDIRLDIELMQDLGLLIEDLGGLNDPPPPPIPTNPWPND